MNKCENCKYRERPMNADPCDICHENNEYVHYLPDIKQVDNINSPTHYIGKIETIDYMQDKLSPEGFEGYLVGNCLKYLSRYKKKNGLEDLKKAEWYLKKLIKTVEGVNEK